MRFILWAPVGLETRVERRRLAGEARTRRCKELNNMEGDKSMSEMPIRKIGEKLWNISCRLLTGNLLETNAHVRYSQCNNLPASVSCYLSLSRTLVSKAPTFSYSCYRLCIPAQSPNNAINECALIGRNAILKSRIL